MPTVNTHGLAEESVAPNENEVISHFIAFIEKASVARNPQGPILRFNQARTAGCVEGEFTVRDDFPTDDRSASLPRHTRFARSSGLRARRTTRPIATKTYTACRYAWTTSPVRI